MRPPLAPAYVLLLTISAHTVLGCYEDIHRALILMSHLRDHVAHHAGLGHDDRRHTHRHDDEPHDIPSCLGDHCFFVGKLPQDIDTHHSELCWFESSAGDTLLVAQPPPASLLRWAAPPDAPAHRDGARCGRVDILLL